MSSRSYLLSAGIIVATAGWLASGYIAQDADGAVPEPAPVPAAAPAAEPMRVAVERLAGEAVVRELSVQGQAEPNRHVVLKVETDGRVEQLPAERGSPVQAGQPLVQLATDDRQARLARAEALVARHAEELAAFESLRSQGFQSTTDASRARADLASAKADLAAIALDIDRTVIHAPFEGVLESREVELGEAVRSGDPLLTVVDIDPLVVSGQVPQHSIAQLSQRAPATVILATGERLQGRVRYIARMSDPQTRTFRVEVEVPNPDGTLPAGVSAELRFPLDTVHTHFISPALLSLDPAGVLGVKTVDADDRVVFNPVSIVRSGADGLWVSGLPPDPRVITSGQGFVAEGETVIADSVEPG